MNYSPDEVLNVASVDPKTTDEAHAKLVAAAVSDGFDDEVLMLPETTQSLNRMGMDTISCVGCQ